MVLLDPDHDGLLEFVGYFDHLLQILLGDAPSRVVTRRISLLREQHQFLDQFWVGLNRQFQRLDGLLVVARLQSCTVAARSQGQVGRVQGAGKGRLKPEIIRYSLYPGVVE